MKVGFTVEVFGSTITHTIDIPEYDLESVPIEEQDDCIQEYITNEINNDMQVYFEKLNEAN